MTIKCFIVEDEENSQNILKTFLTDYCQDVEVVGMAKSIETATEKIKELSPDLVFLDIELEDGNGFELLTQFSPFDFILVFTTGYEQYSVEAVKHMAIDYILKPYSIPIIQDCIVRAKERLKTWKIMKLVDTETDSSIRKTLDEKLTLKSGKGTILIDPNDILFVKVDDPYCRIYILGQKSPIIIQNTLTNIASKLSNNFFKVHRSYLINLNYVTAWDKGRGGNLKINNETVIPIAIRQKREFKKRIAQINI